MRKLTYPAVDDGAVLLELAKSRGGAAKAIFPLHPAIRLRYETYLAASGDPWQVNTDATYTPQKKAFNSLYSQPPVALKASLNALRQGLAGACPMCGRDSLGTLDHYLPKADYPEFSFFAPNLVPACSRCNTKRQTSVKGSKPSQRALHPYFDAYAGRRVMTVELLPPWLAPEIKPIPFTVVDAEFDVVAWQIENVVLPSGFVAYAAPIWANLVRSPTAFLGVDPSEASIKHRLSDLVTMEELHGESLNGWRSCIYHGILHNPQAIAHLSRLVLGAVPAKPVVAP